MKHPLREVQNPGSQNRHNVIPVPWYIRNPFVLLWFGLAAFLLFGQTITFDYTYLDDHTLVLEQSEKFQSAGALLQAFREDAFHAPAGKGYYYRPVLTLSFIVDAMVGRGKLSQYHLSNIIYHILASWLFFILLLRLKQGRLKSFWFGLLFLVHPLCTQAVSWVPGRNDTLLAIFVLGSFISWIYYIDTGQRRYIWLHLSGYALALLTKENGLVLPVIILYFSILVRKIPSRRYTFPVIGWIVITLGWVILRNMVLYSSGKVPLSVQLVSMLKNLPAILPFLGKIFFPFDLSVFPILADMLPGILFGLGAVIVLLILIGLTKPRAWWFYGFGLIWFLAFLVPSFVSINNQIPNFSEHRAYLAMPGMFMLVASLYPVIKADFAKPRNIVVMLVVAGGLSTITFMHSRHFSDRFAFWTNAVESSPSHAFNYNNLGAMYYLRGDKIKAEEYFRKALKINPAEPMANSNTGLVCMDTKRPAEAEKYFLEEIRVNPVYDHAYFNLALLFAQHARYEEAVAWWEKTLQINPYYPDAYRMLLVTYRNMGKEEEMEKVKERANQAGIAVQ